MRGSIFKVYLELCKLRIALFAALSAATGWILVNAELTTAIFIPVLGVFFLACGAGALNQYQERTADALMERTRSRPIPSGRIEARHALYASGLLIITGFAILAITGNLIAIGLGMFAVTWYNLIYTYLKKKTAFAAVPGALTGAIPPAIGWVTGGGGLTDYELLAVCFFFFMWQVPHFWLLLLSRNGDFTKAGMPSLNRVFSCDQLTKITYVWIFAAAVSSLFIPLFGVATSQEINILLIAAAAWIVLRGVKFSRQNDKAPFYPLVFKNINMYVILVMCILNAGRLF